MASGNFEHLYHIDNTLYEFFNESDQAKLITTKEVSIEIQRRLEVDSVVFNDTDLMTLINHAFDWLVEQGFLNELHLN